MRPVRRHIHAPPGNGNILLGWLSLREPPTGRETDYSSLTVQNSSTKTMARNRYLDESPAPLLSWVCVNDVTWKLTDGTMSREPVSDLLGSVSSTRRRTMTAAATRRSPRTPARGPMSSQKQDRGDPDPHRSDRGYLRGRRLRRKSKFLVPRISNFDAGIRVVTHAPQL